MLYYYIIIHLTLFFDSSLDLAVKFEQLVIVHNHFKVLLIQEQLSKNRVFVEKDNKGEVSCNVQSSTHERKTKTNLLFNKGKIYLKFSRLGVYFILILLNFCNYYSEYCTI